MEWEHSCPFWEVDVILEPEEPMEWLSSSLEVEEVVEEEKEVVEEEVEEGPHHLDFFRLLLHCHLKLLGSSGEGSQVE